MRNGHVVSIHITAKAAQPTTEVTEARAVPGRGLEGNRYFFRAGTFSDKDGPDRELTLIEAEAIEALQRDYKVEIAPGQARRDVVTRGVALNHLVGREFQIGEVRVRGIRLCEPCSHLAKLTDDAVMRGLVHRGGLRAQIMSEGVIRPGDPIRVADA
jgi:MOSC domain-containing protein YiiM